MQPISARASFVRREGRRARFVLALLLLPLVARAESLRLRGELVPVVEVDASRECLRLSDGRVVSRRPETMQRLRRVLDGGVTPGSCAAAPANFTPAVAALTESARRCTRPFKATELWVTSGDELGVVTFSDVQGEVRAVRLERANEPLLLDLLTLDGVRGSQCRCNDRLLESETRCRLNLRLPPLFCRSDADCAVTKVCVAQRVTSDLPATLTRGARCVPDAIPPQVVLVDLAPVWSVDHETITAAVTDNREISGAQLLVDGALQGQQAATGTAYAFHLLADAVPEGAHTISVLAHDARGNVGEASATVVVDLAPPLVDGDLVDGALLAALPGHLLEWTLLVSDTMPTLATTTSPSAFTSALPAGGGAVAVSTLLHEGLNVIEFTVTDAAGRSAVYSRSIFYDSVAPVVSATATPPPNASGWNESAVTVVLAATDAGSPAGVAAIHWSLDGVPLADVPGATASLTVSTEGAHTLTYFATDFAGNAGPAQSLPVRIEHVVRKRYSAAIDFRDLAGLLPDKTISPATARYYTIAQFTALFDELAAHGINRVYYWVSVCGRSLYGGPTSGFADNVLALFEGDGRWASYGVLNTLRTYDPMAVAVQLARERQIEIFAWISPFDLACTSVEDEAREPGYPGYDLEAPLYDPVLLNDPSLEWQPLPGSETAHWTPGTVIDKVEIVSARTTYSGGGIVEALDLATVQLENHLFTSTDGVTFDPYVLPSGAAVQVTTRAVDGFAGYRLTGLNIQTPYFRIGSEVLAQPAEGSRIANKLNRLFRAYGTVPGQPYGRIPLGIGRGTGLRLLGGEWVPERPGQVPFWPENGSTDSILFDVGQRAFVAAVGGVIVRRANGFPSIGHPAVDAHLEALVSEVYSRYAVDGLAVASRTHGMVRAGDLFDFSGHIQDAYLAQTGRSLLSDVSLGIGLDEVHLVEQQPGVHAVVQQLRADDYTRFLRRLRTLDPSRPVVAMTPRPVRAASDGPAFLAAFGSEQVWDHDAWLNEGAADGVMVMQQDVVDGEQAWTPGLDQSVAQVWSEAGEDASRVAVHWDFPKNMLRGTPPVDVLPAAFHGFLDGFNANTKASELELYEVQEFDLEGNEHLLQTVGNFAVPWAHGYEARVLPEASGPPFTLIQPSASGSSVVQSERVRIESVAEPRVYELTSASGLWDGSAPATVEARVRVEAGNFSRFEISDGARAFPFVLDAQGVSSAGARFDFDTSTFHTVRVVVEAGTASLFVDHASTPALVSTGEPSTRNAVRFGSELGASEWDFVRWTAGSYRPQ